MDEFGVYLQIHSVVLAAPDGFIRPAGSKWKWQPIPMGVANPVFAGLNVRIDNAGNPHPYFGRLFGA